MKSYSWILILVLFLSGFSSCHSDAERYKDILREGSWYVYDIDYSYKLYDDFETPELFDFFHYLLDERNLLFLPGDELMFSKRRIDVNCPDGDRFGYDYYYSGDYIRIGRDGDYMDLFPQGDMNDLTLTLDRIGLENLLSYWALGFLKMQKLFWMNIMLICWRLLTVICMIFTSLIICSVLSRRWRR